ncbi:GyrI-like domain-containing protein [Parvularcula sp. IMCC14364]|uniref:GyrI-like domain-containing protein n=1 Tax=Parvularcula sp. IMCC14364 TaxID=3067902 RepID=UPI0027415589|nr:GyrI-like domain-containing protein [Parvularcula sp. IMCC14364]
MTFERKTLPEQHYVYVEREASYAGNEIAEAMGSGFGEVYMFTEENNMARLAMPMAIYMDMPAGDKMTFRTALFVSEEDAARAEGNIKAATMPAGEVMTTTHIGSYATMNQSHQALWNHMEENGIPGAMPVWEIYVDDPTTKPEEEVRTEIYRAIGPS